MRTARMQYILSAVLVGVLAWSTSARAADAPAFNEARAVAKGRATPPEGLATNPARRNSDTTRLDRGITTGLAAQAGKSGFHALPVARDAFAARGLLAAAAERSIDAQYYIWQGDHTGYLLFEALWQAAERGVRVRLLLDDNNTGGLDETIAALDAHPNIEVRLYNPLFHRTPRWFNYVTDFTRVNHRMHNKSFTVDNRVTVVGGRNIGDDYFAAGHGMAFDDLDVMAVGPIVRRGIQSLRSLLEQRVRLSRRESPWTRRPWSTGKTPGDLRRDARRSGVGGVSRVVA